MTLISASLLSCKDNIEEVTKEFNELDIDLIHLDIMDGEFVQNNTHDTMLEYCEYLDHISKVPLDVHLMVKDVKNYVDSYLIFNPNIITIHYEACKDKAEVMEIINYIKQKGRRVGISIKPDTSIDEIYEFLPYVHVVLIMTVEPGKGGQELIPETVKKIEKLSKYREENNLNFDIEADGGIKVENSEQIINAGADILVAGTVILSSKDFAENIRNLRK